MGMLVEQSLLHVMASCMAASWSIKLAIHSSSLANYQGCSSSRVCVPHLCQQLHERVLMLLHGL